MPGSARPRGLAVLPILASLVALAACAREPHDDLDRYVNVELPKVASYEHQLAGDEAPGKRGLAAVARAYVTTLEAIQPTTPAVRQLHALKLDAARTQAEALACFEAALSHGAANRALGNRARVLFRQQHEQAARYERTLHDLERETGVHDLTPD